MSKNIYKGYELMRAIADGEIKENSKIDVFTDYGAYITTIKYKEGQLNWKAGEFNTGFLCSKEAKFELIEDETIDIESIEELDNTCYDINNMTDDEIECYHNYTRSKINIILQWAKQQEKRIKKLEDKQ